MVGQVIDDLGGRQPVALELQLERYGRGSAHPVVSVGYDLSQLCPEPVDRQVNRATFVNVFKSLSSQSRRLLTNLPRSPLNASAASLT